MSTQVKVQIICAHGASRAGKTSALKVIRDRLLAMGEEFVVDIDFADPLRAAATSLLCVRPDTLARSEYRKTPLERLGDRTPVELMQLLGTEFIRDTISKDFFTHTYKHQVIKEIIKCQKDEALKLGTSTTLWVLTSDARFSDEIDTIYQMASKVAHLLINSDTAKWSPHTSDKMNHDWIVNGLRPSTVPASNHLQVYTLNNLRTLRWHQMNVLSWIDRYHLQYIED